MVSEKKNTLRPERSLNYYMQIADGLFTHKITFMLFTLNLLYIIIYHIKSKYKLIIYSKSTPGYDAFIFII